MRECGLLAAFARKREIDQEKKQEDVIADAASADIIIAFRALGHGRRFGTLKFQSIWAEGFAHAEGPDPNWTDVMERAIVRCQSTGVKVPPLFFKHKRKIESVEVDERYKRTPL